MFDCTREIVLCENSSRVLHTICTTLQDYRDASTDYHLRTRTWIKPLARRIAQRVEGKHSKEYCERGKNRYVRRVKQANPRPGWKPI